MSDLMVLFHTLFFPRDFAQLKRIDRSHIKSRFLAIIFSELLTEDGLVCFRISNFFFQCLF